jgi:ABC-type multidrug transport system fused ATPase/permease subunit
VGPKGSKISGGEKQRVAVARALLRKPQIFLMDEGTSALDRETEKRVQENLDNRLKGKTMISIAHRIETIENSDCIFLFQNGTLVEQGKYVELMKKKSSFEKFVRGAE